MIAAPRRISEDFTPLFDPQFEAVLLFSLAGLSASLLLMQIYPAEAAAWAMLQGV